MVRVMLGLIFSREWVWWFSFLDSDGVDVVTPTVSVAKERPPKKSNKTSYSWFDPGEGDSTIFELPTEEMVEYITKKFTAYISERKLK